MRIKRRFRPFVRFCVLATVLVIGFRSLNIVVEKQRGIHDDVIDRCNMDTIIDNTDVILTINKTCKLDVLAASAICRARTETCRNQIRDVACRIYNNSLIPKRLPRYCQREAENKKGEEMGCYQRRQFSHLFIPLSDDETSPEACVKRCFMGGDKYAAPELHKLRCWCGNTLDIKSRLSDDSCDPACLDTKSRTCATNDNVKVFSTGAAGLDPVKTHLVTSEKEVESMKPVRIVFVLTVSGRAARQIRRLLKAIYHVDHYYYIHIDSRDDYLYRELQKIEDIFSNVRLARERFATIWGGASRLQAHLFIMRTLLRMSDWNWDYYINLSETHYPLKKITSLAMYLQMYQGNNFIQMIKTLNPITDKDKIFVECDEHMWLLKMKQNLPGGITFHSGFEWICLYRDFVEYASTGTDPLLTGLKQMYKHIMAAEESFFLVLLLNSKFCRKWIDENMHFIHWFREKGCSCVREEVDVCGCSPLDIRLKDFQETISHLNDSPQFWARKLEPIIDQEILNSIDTLLGISYNGDQSMHRYWQNEFHFLDHPRATTMTADLIKTFAYSFMRRAMRSVTDCVFTDVQLIETHVLNVDDKFDSYLVKFSATKENRSASAALECRFRPIQHYRIREQMELAKRLVSLKVGTKYDKKEEIFRNYPGFFGPLSSKLTLQYSFNEGLEGNVTFSWIVPSGKTVSVSEKHITTGVKNGVDILNINSTSTLQTGVWKILVEDKRIEIAELEFLVLPLSVSAECLSAEIGGDQKLYIQIDELTAQFWRAEGLCSSEDLESECSNISPCRHTDWSSMSPDPKSSIAHYENLPIH